MLHLCFAEAECWSGKREMRTYVSGCGRGYRYFLSMPIFYSAGHVISARLLKADSVSPQMVPFIWEIQFPADFKDNIACFWIPFP